MLKLDEPFRNQEIFIISLFSLVQIWVQRVKIFFWQFLVDILPLGSRSVDPHIFADPVPGSQNLADPTDPDPYPKHCSKPFFSPNFLQTFLLSNLPLNLPTLQPSSKPSKWLIQFSKLFYSETVARKNRKKGPETRGRFFLQNRSNL